VDSNVSEAVREGENVTLLPLIELHPFPNHPFKVRDDDAMREMQESVMEHGILTPAIVRPRQEGGYEIVAGHRRKHACELAELDVMPCIIRSMDDDLATIFMVDSNIQREDVLPCEKAAAYKMKIDAIKRRAGRPSREEINVSGNCGQVGHNFRGMKSRDIIAENLDDSPRTVQRYIRLNELSPELQQMVDDKKIAVTPAVELSYLKPEEQAMLVETIKGKKAVPSLSQAQRLKKSSQAGSLDRDTMRSIMEEPPTQAPSAPSQAAAQPETEAPAPPLAAAPPEPEPSAPPTAAASPEPTPAIQPKTAAPPKSAAPTTPRPRRGQIADDIARLKDPNKVCPCTPQMLLTGISELASRFGREIEVFAIPYYELVFPVLTPDEMAALREHLDAICAATDKFYEKVKGMNTHDE